MCVSIEVIKLFVDKNSLFKASNPCIIILHY